jgi:hypothetical protein
VQPRRAHVEGERQGVEQVRRPAAFITDPIEVGAYDHRFAKLEHAAVFGDEARTVFARVADEYRALGEPTRGTGGPIRSR